MPPHISPPVIANFDSSRLTIASGAAIFHIKSERVVLCYHTRDKYYFLPKGRRDANEESGAAAEREGFEESGFPNRLLPLPVKHRQPAPHNTPRATFNPFTTEPVWTQLVPLSSRRQYLLFWYICETLPPEDEAAWLLARSRALGGGSSKGDERKQDPSSSSLPPPSNGSQYTGQMEGGGQRDIPPYPRNMTFEERMSMEPEGWQPTRVEGTGVDEEEACYVAGLYTIARAMELLKGSLGVEIVRTGWELILLRKEIEREVARSGGAE